MASIATAPRTETSALLSEAIWAFIQCDRCGGSIHVGHCKHLGMVVDQLRARGLALPAGGRLIIRPGVGLIEEGRPDPFSRIGSA